MDAFDNPVMTRPAAERSLSFWAELRDYWERTPDKWLFLALFAGWCVLFQFVGISSFNFGETRPSLFEWLHTAWNTPAFDSSQGNLIPFVVVVLFWVKRRELESSMTGVWWPALAVVGLALSIHIFGFLAQQPRVSMIGLFMGIYGLIGLVWGWRTMWASTFPMALFAFCMPLGTFAQGLTLPMRLMAATWTRVICHSLLGIDVIQQGTALVDPHDLKFNYDVAVACSGIRSFVALLAVTTVFAVLSFKSIWKRLVMVAMTFPLVLACNVLRLTVVILVTQAYSRKEGEWVHGWFGFVTYMVSIGALLAVAQLLKEKPSGKAHEQE
jgi:exosortase